MFYKIESILTKTIVSQLCIKISVMLKQIYDGPFDVLDKIHCHNKDGVAFTWEIVKEKNKKFIVLTVPKFDFKVKWNRKFSQTQCNVLVNTENLNIATGCTLNDLVEIEMECFNVLQNMIDEKIAKDAVKITIPKNLDNIRYERTRDAD